VERRLHVTEDQQEAKRHALHVQAKKWDYEDLKRPTVGTKTKSAVWKSRRCRRDAKYEEDPGQRKKVEKEEHDRWTKEVVDIISEAGLPRIQKAHA